MSDERRATGEISIIITAVFTLTGLGRIWFLRKYEYKYLWELSKMVIFTLNCSLCSSFIILVSLVNPSVQWCGDDCHDWEKLCRNLQ